MRQKKKERKITNKKEKERKVEEKREA